MNNEMNMLNAVLRTDLTTFTRKVATTLNPSDQFSPNWHHHAIGHALQECIDGDTKRLIITVPPRYLKSIFASVALPAFYLGNHPSKKIISISYAQNLSDKHHGDCREIMSSQWYKTVFPNVQLSKSKNTQSEFRTVQHGSKVSTSVDGTITGLGADIIIVDDAQKAQDAYSENKRQSTIDWVTSTLFTRLNSKKDGIIIVIQQRLHENDLVGHLLEKQGWKHLNLPAIAEAEQKITLTNGMINHRKEGDILHPERESAEILERISDEMGSYAFAAQYQQNPRPLTGGLININALKYYKNTPKSQAGDMIVQSWDTATGTDKNHDYSVCTTWIYRVNSYILLDVFRERIDFTRLSLAMNNLAIRYSVNLILIEGGSDRIGTALRNNLKPSLNAIEIKNVISKEERVIPCTATLEAGKIFVPENALWLEPFLNELASFPRAKHDDMVDSWSQFITWADEKARSSNEMKQLNEILDDIDSNKPIKGREHEYLYNQISNGSHRNEDWYSEY